MVRLLKWFAVVAISGAIGMVAAALLVRYAAPAPPLLPGGGREGTPVQIVVFLGVFGLVFAASLAAGFTLLYGGSRKR